MKKWFCLLLAAVLLTLCGLAGAETASVPEADAAATAQTAVEEEIPATEEAPVEDETPAGEAESSGWLAGVFSKIAGLKWYTLVILAVLVVFAVVMTVGAKHARWDARVLSNAAVCVAVGFVLSCIPLWRMPQGGTVTPVAMLPLILFAMTYGPVRGFIAGCVFGLLNLVQDPYVIHPVQMLLDYPLAYAAVALCCAAKLFKTDKRYQLLIAVPLGYFGRFVIAVLSGVVFFAEYAGDEGALVYSIVYNISYLGIEAILCMLVALIPGISRLPEIMEKRANA